MHCILGQMSCVSYELASPGVILCSMKCTFHAIIQQDEGWQCVLI